MTAFACCHVAHGPLQFRCHLFGPLLIMVPVNIVSFSSENCEDMCACDVSTPQGAEAQHVCYRECCFSSATYALTSSNSLATGADNINIRLQDHADTGFIQGKTSRSSEHTHHILQFYLKGFKPRAALL